MAFTLSEVLQAMYRYLGQFNVTTATGGSTTTFVDSKQVGLHRDNSWKDGACFVTRDAGGANAAPEGQFARCSTYVNTSGTFTVDTALTAAVASGDTFGFVSSYYPLYQMIQAVNDGLRNLGDMPLVDTTTLDTIAGDTEYAAAVAWKRARPYRIDIQGRTGDSADNQWEETTDWEWVPAAAGSAGRIIFGHYPLGSRDIRVWYHDRHGVVNAYSDVINERLDPQLAVLAATQEALNWQNSRVQGADPFLLQLSNKCANELEMRLAKTPIQKPKRRPKLLIVGRDDKYLRDDRVRPPPPP
jgi:hypothetical protein